MHGYRPTGHTVLWRTQAFDRKGEKDTLGTRRCQAVGEPQVRVRLGQRGGDPPRPGRQHHRARDVAASAEDDVGSSPREDLTTGKGRSDSDREGARQVNTRPPREARHVECVELEASLRDEL